MKLRINRIALAAVLTVLAIAVPSVAWYVAGVQSTQREADRIKQHMLFGAFKAAHGLAQRFGGHLEALRESESRRPFYHYEPTFHDPDSNCECASVTPSPLVRGSGDPLILAHFQLDAKGRVTTPTLSFGRSVRRDPDWIREQVRILHQIEGLKPMLVGMVTFDPARGAVYALPGTGSRSPKRPEKTTEEAKRSRRAQWREAAEYGATFNIGAPSRLFSRPDQPHYANQGGPDFAGVKVGFFEWHTVELAGEPTLLAARRVATSRRSLLQCFLISNEVVNSSLRGVSYYPGEFVPGELVDPDDQTKLAASVALPAVDWRVVIDAGVAAAAAEERGAEVKTVFRRTFLAVSSASLLAGLCIVGLVFQADRLARQRQRFAASAAHELRTPLAGLRVYGDMLAEGLGDPTKTRDYARRISSEAERLGRVVSNVLGYSRLERGALAVRPERGDLADAVRDCVGRFEAALEAAGARVELAIADPIPSVRFDRDAVFQILQNLLDNAEKYTRGASDRTIRVELARDGNMVELSVLDRGPGISEPLNGRLFEPFTRTNDKDLPAGMGLGLTLVKGMATAHSGSVRYQDRAEGGAVFTVALPVATA